MRGVIWNSWRRAVFFDAETLDYGVTAKQIDFSPVGEGWLQGGATTGLKEELLTAGLNDGGERRQARTEGGKGRADVFGTIQTVLGQ